MAGDAPCADPWGIIPTNICVPLKDTKYSWIVIMPFFFLSICFGVLMKSSVSDPASLAICGSVCALLALEFGTGFVVPRKGEKSHPSSQRKSWIIQKMKFVPQSWILPTAGHMLCAELKQQKFNITLWNYLGSFYPEHSRDAVHFFLLKKNKFISSPCFCLKEQEGN